MSTSIFSFDLLREDSLKSIDQIGKYFAMGKDILISKLAQRNIDIDKSSVDKLDIPTLSFLLHFSETTSYSGEATVVFKEKYGSFKQASMRRMRSGLFGGKRERRAGIYYNHERKEIIITKDFIEENYYQMIYMIFNEEQKRVEQDRLSENHSYQITYKNKHFVALMEQLFDRNLMLQIFEDQTNISLVPESHKHGYEQFDEFSHTEIAMMLQVLMDLPSNLVSRAQLKSIRKRFPNGDIDKKNKFDKEKAPHETHKHMAIVEINDYSRFYDAFIHAIAHSIWEVLDEKLKNEFASHSWYKDDKGIWQLIVGINDIVDQYGKTSVAEDFATFFTFYMTRGNTRRFEKRTKRMVAKHKWMYENIFDKTSYTETPIFKNTSINIEQENEEDLSAPVIKGDLKESISIELLDYNPKRDYTNIVGAEYNFNPRFTDETKSIYLNSKIARIKVDNLHDDLSGVSAVTLNFRQNVEKEKNEDQVDSYSITINSKTKNATSVTDFDFIYSHELQSGDYYLTTLTLTDHNNRTNFVVIPKDMEIKFSFESPHNSCPILGDERALIDPVAMLDEPIVHDYNNRGPELSPECLALKKLKDDIYISKIEKDEISLRKDARGYTVVMPAMFRSVAQSVGIFFTYPQHVKSFSYSNDINDRNVYYSSGKLHVPFRIPDSYPDGTVLFDKVNICYKLSVSSYCKDYFVRDYGMTIEVDNNLEYFIESGVDPRQITVESYEKNGKRYVKAVVPFNTDEMYGNGRFSNDLINSAMHLNGPYGEKFRAQRAYVDDIGGTKLVQEYELPDGYPTGLYFLSDLRVSFTPEKFRSSLYPSSSNLFTIRVPLTETSITMEISPDKKDVEFNYQN